MAISSRIVIGSATSYIPWIFVTDYAKNQLANQQITIPCSIVKRGQPKSILDILDFAIDFQVVLCYFNVSNHGNEMHGSLFSFLWMILKEF